MTAPMPLHCRERHVDFPRRPLIMGIVNINQDSFSGDGSLDVAASLETARRMVREGADIIDVGGESARTNRAPISEQEEIDRLLPFVAAFTEAGFPDQLTPVDAHQVFPPVLSINTWRPRVAESVLRIGGDLLNDIGGLTEPDNAKICARHGVGLVLMHTVGQPKVAHTHVRYEEKILDVVEAFFADRIQRARHAGLPKQALILDPGIDFAKQRSENLALYAGLERLQKFGRPVLVPVSRKTVIGETLGLSEARDRDAGTVACTVWAAEQGGHIFRVHHVAAAWQTVKLLEALAGEKSNFRGAPGVKIR